MTIMKLSSLIKEQTELSGKTLMCVDIQPEYEDYFNFRTNKFLDFIKMNFDDLRYLVFLYNGEDTLNMISEEDYKIWLSDNEGLSDEILDNPKTRFYDKGYAWFRTCMDANIDEQIIVNFVKFMIKNDIHDSRNMDREMWKKYIRENGSWQVTRLLARSEDMVYIPELMQYLKQFNNIVLCGGTLVDCLKEVEIALKALNKPYTIYNKYTY